MIMAFSVVVFVVLLLCGAQQAANSLLGQVIVLAEITESGVAIHIIHLRETIA